MKLIELGTMNAFKNGSSLCFFVPRSWIRYHALDFGDRLYVHCNAVEIRYSLADGLGRSPFVLQEKKPRKPFLVIPKYATERLAIEARTSLVLFSNQEGTLIVRRAK